MTEAPRTPRTLSPHQLDAALRGERLAEVHYFTFDWTREDLAPDHEGLRTITTDTEWSAPDWRYPAFDAVEWGFELRLESGRVFSFVWPSPMPEDECTQVQETPFADTGVRLENGQAKWRVTERSRWSTLIGQEILGVRGPVDTPAIGMGPDGAPESVEFDANTRQPYPACYVLDFEDRAVFVLGAEACGGDRLQGIYDAVAVVFGLARDVGST